MRIPAALAIALSWSVVLGGPAEAAADCHAIGTRIAAERNAELARAVPEERNGQAVCVIVILEAGQPGERRKRTVIEVPQE